MRHVKNTHVNTAFLLSIFIAFIITIVSLFTSGWRRYSSEEINEGIITHHSAVSLKDLKEVFDFSPGDISKKRL